MIVTNPVSPEQLSPKARRREVATLLALGLARLRLRNAESIQKRAPQNEFGLGFSARQSVHVTPSQLEP